MGLACTNQQSTGTECGNSPEEEEIDLLTPRPSVKKEIVFIWNLDVFQTLMLSTCLKESKEKEILQDQMKELVLDLAESYFYYKDLQEYNIISIYDNPLLDTGQNVISTEEAEDQYENMSAEDKKMYNKISSQCRNVNNSFCQKCQENINNLISNNKEKQWLDVQQKLTDVKDNWLSEAIKSLQIINSRKSCVNILVTSSHLIEALSYVLLFGLGNIFRIENIYSSGNIGKEQCFRRIVNQFGSDCNVFVFGASNQDEKLAEKLKMAFWKVADQSDVDSLHHALTLNYL